MEIHKIQIADLMHEPKMVFSIPVYQRNYKWEIEECSQLLKDIFAVGRDNRRSGHFLGSIVYINHGNTAIGSVKEYAVIDGQQRLTTLTLIFAVLYLLAKEQGNENEAADMYDYIMNQRVPDSEKLKLKPTEDYTVCLQHILGETTANVPKDSRIIKNFNYFRKEIKLDDYQTVKQGIAKLVLVQIKLDEHDDDPQQIFESLNAKGKPLEQGDLIRNYILMALPETIQAEYYNQYWKPIEQNTKDEALEKERTSAFIRDFLTYRTYSLKRKIINESKVYDEFKFYRQETHENLEQLLSDLKTLSGHYQKFLNPKYETDQEIRKQLEYINRLKVGVIYPFLMSIFEDYRNSVIDKETLIAVLEFCQAYVFRRAIANLATGPINKIFAALYEKIDKNDYLLSIQRALLFNAGTIRFPSDDEVRRELKVRDVYNFNVYYLFERLENYQNKERVMLPSKDITVEHIFPQTPDTNWEQLLPQDELEEISKLYLHTIGNLTLSGNNGALSNKTFVEKRDMNVNDKEQGYKFSRLWLNRGLQQLDVWNKEQIEKRTQQLTERFLQVWMYPDVLPENMLISYEEVNIFEASDPSRQKIDYAVFRGARLESNSLKKGAIKGLYLAIVQKLFAENPDKFLQTNLKQRLTITEAPLRGQARNGQNLLSSKLADGWYIKSTANPETLFKWIKTILIDFGLRDALRIKYRER